MNIVDERSKTDIKFSDLKVGELFEIPVNDVLYLKISSMMYDGHGNSRYTVANVVDLVDYDLHTFEPQVVVKPIYNAALVLS